MGFSLTPGNRQVYVNTLREFSPFYDNRLLTTHGVVALFVLDATILYGEILILQWLLGQILDKKRREKCTT